MTSSSLRAAVTTVLFVAAATVVPLQPADAASTKERLDSIERKLDSRGLLDMLNRVEQMQRDIQQLRGDIEVQTHTLQNMQRRSREQYMDIDRRLQQLESGEVAVTPPVVAPADPLDPPPISRPPGAASTPPPVGPAAVPAPPQAGEQEAYDTALAILREGRYAEAVQSFNRFLVDYPGSSYADNASYWLGETYYVTREFDRSLTTFKGLIEQYPDSPKAADSRLKMGYIYYEQQDWTAARQTLKAVIAEYPGSTAARLASDRLKRMKKEGH